MPIVTIKTKGLDRVRRGVRRLPKEALTAIYGVTEKTAKFIQKSAKLRTRRWTGTLASNIKVKKTKKGNWIIESGAPYATFQEYGFSRHWVHIDMPTRAGHTIKDWLAMKHPEVLESGKKFIKVGGLSSSFRPHLRPALEKGLERNERMLDLSVRKAIHNAFR